MCHGTKDYVVRFEWGKLSFQFIQKLRGSSENIKFLEYEGLQHTSSPKEIADVIQWLKQCIS